MGRAKSQRHSRVRLPQSCTAIYEEASSTGGIGELQHDDTLPCWTTQQAVRAGNSSSIAMAKGYAMKSGVVPKEVLMTP